MLKVSVILYAPMPKTLGPEYRGSAFCLFSWWQDCISVEGYTSVFSTVAAPLAALSSLLSGKESCVPAICLGGVWRIPQKGIVINELPESCDHRR